MTVKCQLESKHWECIYQSHDGKMALTADLCMAVLMQLQGMYFCTGAAKCTRCGIRPASQLGSSQESNGVVLKHSTCLQHLGQGHLSSFQWLLSPLALPAAQQHKSMNSLQSDLITLDAQSYCPQCLQQLSSNLSSCLTRQLAMPLHDRTSCSELNLQADCKRRCTVFPEGEEEGDGGEENPMCLSHRCSSMLGG